MSKYLTFPEVVFKSQELLVQALQNYGFKEVEVHDKPQHLIGYHGDVRSQTAEVIVRRKYVGGASNDIGFKLNDQGAYVPIISEFDNRRFSLPRLRTEYGKATAFRVSRQLRGRVEMKMQGKTQKLVVVY